MSWTKFGAMLLTFAALPATLRRDGEHQAGDSGQPAAAKPAETGGPQCLRCGISEIVDTKTSEFPFVCIACGCWGPTAHQVQYALEELEASPPEVSAGNTRPFVEPAV